MAMGKRKRDRQPVMWVPTSPNAERRRSDKYPAVNRAGTAAPNAAVWRYAASAVA